MNIAVTEGPRAIVATRKVEGAEHLSADEIEKILVVETGEPFNPNEVRQDSFSLQNEYRNRGWREAAVKDDWTVSPDGTAANVVYTVEEGMRSFFGKTIVRGNTRTSTDRITRLVSWDEGDPFSEQEVLSTQRNLTRTGVFRRVELSPQPADPATQVRTVDIEVREGRPLSLLYGLGYQYAPDALENRHDPFGIVGVSYNNLFGTMRSASLELQYAPLSSRGRVIATFREPFLFNRDIPLTLLVFFTREPIQKIDIERLGTVLESSRLFGNYLRVGLRYEYQRIEPVNAERDLSTIEREFSKFDRPILQSAIGPNLFYDRRDDVIDPHRGYYLTGATKYAFPLAQCPVTEDPENRELCYADYLKLSGQAAYFRPFGGGVFAVSARAGAISSYGEEQGVPVPIAERFFAGGRSTNRAFETDLLGTYGLTVDPDTRALPRTEDGVGSCADSYPDLLAEHPELALYDCDAGPRIVGGNGFLGVNAEFRFPIFGNVGGTVFYDAAQVWKNPADIRVSLEGDDGLRQGIGVGLRYMTPIGPVRVEYGWPLDARTVPFSVKVLDEVGQRRRNDPGGHAEGDGPVLLLDRLSLLGSENAGLGVAPRRCRRARRLRDARGEAAGAEVRALRKGHDVTCRAHGSPASPRAGAQGRDPPGEEGARRPRGVGRPPPRWPGLTEELRELSPRALPIARLPNEDEDRVVARDRSRELRPPGFVDRDPDGVRAPRQGLDEEERLARVHRRDELAERVAQVLLGRRRAGGRAVGDRVAVGAFAVRDLHEAETLHVARHRCLRHSRTPSPELAGELALRGDGVGRHDLENCPLPRHAVHRISLASSRASRCAR